MALYYHDTVWTGVNRQAMNKAFLAALKSGGVLLVIDHHALPTAPETAEVGADEPEDTAPGDGAAP